MTYAWIIQVYFVSNGSLYKRRKATSEDQARRLAAWIINHDAAQRFFVVGEHCFDAEEPIFVFEHKRQTGRYDNWE